MNGLYSVPIIGIFLLGIMTKHVPAIAAKFGMVIGMIVYSFFSFINLKNVPAFFADGNGELHWLHGYFISFVLSITVMLLIGYFYPKSIDKINQSEKIDPAPVDITPWKYAKHVSCLIAGATLGIYFLLSLAAG